MAISRPVSAVQVSLNDNELHTLHQPVPFELLIWKDGLLFDDGRLLEVFEPMFSLFVRRITSTCCELLCHVSAREAGQARNVSKDPAEMPPKWIRMDADLARICTTWTHMANRANLLFVHCPYKQSRPSGPGPAPNTTLTCFPASADQCMTSQRLARVFLVWTMDQVFILQLLLPRGRDVDLGSLKRFQPCKRDPSCAVHTDIFDI